MCAELYDHFVQSRWRDLRVYASAEQQACAFERTSCRPRSRALQVRYGRLDISKLQLLEHGEVVEPCGSPKAHDAGHRAVQTVEGPFWIRAGLLKRMVEAGLMTHGGADPSDVARDD